MVAPPPTEPLPEPRRAEQRPASLGVVVAVAAVVSLIAGTLGAAIGVWATRTTTTGGTLTGAEPQVDREFGSVAEVVSDIMPSVVTVLTSGGGNGSGFIVSDDGYILTNHHVVAAGGQAASQLQVLMNSGEVEPAEVIGSDADSDVAVIKIGGGDHPAMVLADSDALAVGDPVLAVGAPLGLSSTVTQGIISALDRPVLTQNEAGEVEAVMAAIQTDAAINPGNSGGPLTDSGGQVIGINTAIASFASEGEQAGNIGIGFAIPINQAKRIADEIIETGSASRTVLGAELGDSQLGIGVTLSAIQAGSPAEAAGLRDGDILTNFNGKTITENTELVALVRKLAPGTTVTVVYLRDGEEGSAQVTLAAASD
jgi:putative serine protease PepD